MKKSVLTGIALFITCISFSHSDTTKVEQYCQVIATQRLLSNKVTIDIDFGNEKNFWLDGRIKDYDGRIKKFDTIIDAMNFMGKDGWIFISAYPVHNGNSEIYHFAFKKRFYRSEVN